MENQIRTEQIKFACIGDQYFKVLPKKSTLGQIEYGGLKCNICFLEGSFYIKFRGRIRWINKFVDKLTN